MRHLLTVLLVLLFVALAFGQDFSQGEPEEDYLKMSYYIYWTQRYADLSQQLYHNPQALIAEYNNYKGKINGLWQDLGTFEKYLNTTNQVYSKAEFNLLLSNTYTLKQLEKKVNEKYIEITAPENSGLTWGQVLQYGVKAGLTSALMAGMYANRDWEMNPARNREFLALSIMVPVSKKMYFTLDHYQGITASVNYRLVQSFPMAGGLTEPIELWVSAQAVYNGSSIRKIMLGPIFQLRVFSGLHFYSGILGQIYLKKSDLPVNDPEANRMIAPIVGLRFNPFH